MRNWRRWLIARLIGDEAYIVNADVYAGADGFPGVYVPPGASLTIIGNIHGYRSPSGATIVARRREGEEDTDAK